VLWNVEKHRRLPGLAWFYRGMTCFGDPGVSAGAAEPVSGSKITSTSHLTVDQGIACPALTTPETEATIMPDPEFTLAPGTNNWMQISLGDPLKDEIFMTQNIRTSNGRATIRINRLGKADDQGVRHFISSITLTDAGHGDVLGLQRKGNVPEYRHLLTRASRYRQRPRQLWPPDSPASNRRRLASVEGSLVSTSGSASRCRAARR
jgi:hypothetical protein